MINNPLISSFNTLHGVPPFELFDVSFYLPAFDFAIAQGRKEIDEIIKSSEMPDFKNTIEAIENAGSLLTKVSNVFFNLNHAHTNPEIQAVARDVSPRLTEFNNDIWLNDVLFEKVKQVFDLKDVFNLNAEQNQLLENTYKAFVRKGALLNSKDKEKYRDISKQLSDLSLQFGENVLAETNDFHLHINNIDDLDGLPDSLIEYAAEQAKEMEKDGWVFTMHMPSFLPFMKYSNQRELRRKMFIAYSSRANHNNNRNNQTVIKQIVTLRLEKAQLLGYKCYADFVLEERMAKETSRVIDFLNELLDASIDYAKNDVHQVKEYAKKIGFTNEFEKWDFAFYSEKLKNEKYSIDDEVLKPYFKLENVEMGVFDLANQLWGLTFVESLKIPVYHSDVKAFEVFDENGEFISVLYVDYFPRSSKQGGAWMTSYRDQKKIDNKTIRPVVSLVMNFSRPTATKPSLLTHNEVSTFLHEFGHALHGMLSNVTYESLSGTNVYRDFVELPSQLMENWSIEKEWLKKVALHYKTSEPIPDVLIQKIIDSSNFQSGYAMVRQLSFGLVDMSWHSITESFGGNVVDFERHAMQPTLLLPDIEGTCTCTSFSHIFDGGYAAGYYGYKWAEVLDADAFEMFKENGIFDSLIAKKFRNNILEKGGVAHPMDLYVAFRGSEPSIEPLLKRSGLGKK
ncbi:MAG: M3 family metallopeptidase [Marinilabiliaceae bacterium]|nr:M3 family metallopeptidase [Marinilabiliaceae bacterium]